MADQPRLIVVGGGLAGLMTVVRAAELGIPVDLFSLIPVKRSHSVCAQGGINGAVNTKGEGDSPDIHFDDSIYGGDFLANQPPVKAMCYAAPGIIYLLDRMGVMFNRTPEGLLDFRRFGGTKHHRTAFAGATTGQQLLYALDEQTRRWEDAGLVKKYEFHEFLEIVRDDNGRCAGIVALDLRSMQVQTYRGGAVALATGGPGLIFGRSTNSLICTGSAVSAVYQQGAKYGNGEFIQVHPTAIPGADKLRLMSESARGEGGRVWVPKSGGDKRAPKSIPENERWYFLEEKYPAYGNLVPRDIATREIFKVCVDQKMGVDGENAVYLDLTHKPVDELNRKLGGILEIYEKFIGVDPRVEPMKVFPAVHYSMGGLWVDYNQTTNVPGLYAVGECDYSIHGANRLGANSLLSCLTAGQIAGPHMAAYARSAGDETSSTLFDAQQRRWQEKIERIYSMSGNENPHRIHDELGTWMTDNCTVVRYNDRLEQTEAKITELMDRYQRIGLTDTSRYQNQEVAFINQLWNMLELARVMVRGALLRNESRGAHYKPDFPERDDAKFLKTTIAEWSADGPRISYEEVDTSLIKPRPRRYDVPKEAAKTSSDPAIEREAKGAAPVTPPGMNP